MQYVCGQMSRAAQKRNLGRGSQRLHHALGGTRILLAAATTVPPCFCRWQRSSLLHRGFLPAGLFGGSYELRLPLFPQPLGRALKKRSAAPASPPCFRRRRRSAPLLFESTRSMSLALSQNKNLSALAYAEAFWWSEATQIRTIALWGIFGGDFIESDGFCAVFVVECNQNFFIIEINSIHECIDERFPVAFHVRVELAEPGQPETNLIFA